MWFSRCGPSVDMTVTTEVSVQLCSNASLAYWLVRGIGWAPEP